MRVLLIPDKFKGSLDAKEVVGAISKGIRLARPDAEIHSVLASDGGDGFLDAVLENVNCKMVTVETVDPLGRTIEADYLRDAATQSAYIELARASGLALLRIAEPDAIHTSTFGTGLQIRNSIENGAKNIYLGLGGSATNDGGTGIAKALGYRFLDAQGNELEGKGSDLGKIENIDSGGVIPNVKAALNKDISKTNSTGWDDPNRKATQNDISFYAINDVDNPLVGPRGAAHVYGAQKGASISEIRVLDKGLRHLDSLVSHRLGKSFANHPGCGAAGGTAYGLKAFCNAEFISGIAFVLQLSKVDDILKSQAFDYIVTGEGKFDRQTLHGKLIKGVSDLGVKYHVPVVAFCGLLALTPEEKKVAGPQKIIEIRDVSKPVEYSMINAAELLRECASRFFKEA